MARSLSARPTPAPQVEHVQALLRAVATAQECLAAAAVLEPEFPALAEVLAVYGAGRTDEARAHYRRVNP